MLVPVAARAKVQVSGRSPAEIVGSNPTLAWVFVCRECCVLSDRGLCDELITRPEESYRLWCVVVCDLENLVNEEAMTRVGSQRHKKEMCKQLLNLVDLRYRGYKFGMVTFRYGNFFDEVP